MLFLPLLLFIIPVNGISSSYYREGYQHQHHHHQTNHHMQRTSQDITQHVRHGSRIRDYCQSGYWNAQGNCADNIRVNYVTIESPGENRRCHYIVTHNSHDGRVYDATCESRIVREDFERAPLSRHTYGDVYGLNPNEYIHAKNYNDRQPGDPLYRSATTTSIVSTFLFMTIPYFIM